MAPGVTLTANLKLVIDGAAADQAKLQITLCGFGAVIPLVSGEGLLADAGIPKTEIQEDSTPISLELYNNQAIWPLGTFYCIAVLDDQDNVIQANDYQFNADGDFDLSEVQPITPGIPSIFNEPAARISFTQYKVSKQPIGAMIGVFYNGKFQRPTTDYTMNGLLINLKFVTVPTDTVSAVYMALGNGGVMLQPGLTIDELLITTNGQNVFMLTRHPYQGVLMGVYYNGDFQGTELYALDDKTLTLTFSTYDGDNLYAVYFGYD